MSTFTNEEIQKIVERDEQDKYWDELREVFRKVSQGITRNNNRSGERAIWELLQNAADLCEKPAVIELRLTQTDLIFTHHGKAFTQKTLEDLIRQRSSKDGKTKVGRFGTGFMTTHVFNRKVYVSGACLVELENKKLYLPFEEFCINRDYDDQEQFIKEVDIALQEKKKILTHEGTENDIYPTVFRYPLIPEKLQHISEQLAITKRLMPYVLAFNDTIKECVVYDEYSGTITQFVKMDVTITQCFHNTNICLCDTIIKISSTTEPISVRTLCNKGRTDRIVIPPFPVGFDDTSMIPSQFLFFPLLGSENFGTNFILHSRRLTPTEPRDSYELPKDNDNLTKVYKENERVLNEMFNMLFDYFYNYPEEQHKLTEQYSMVNFGTASVKRAADEVERDYYKRLQEQFATNMASYSVLPYIVKENDKDKVQYTSINSGIIKVLDPALCTSIRNLDEQLQLRFLPVIEKYARKVVTLPSQNILGWSDVVASWDSTQTSWYVTLDQICACIQDNGNELHDFLLLLKALRQIGTDLMKKYPLIPNRKGMLCKLDYLSVGKTISKELYAIAYPIIRERGDIIVDIDYEDVCDRNEYTRINLRDDIGSAIDNLRKQTLERIDINNPNSYNQQLLNDLQDSTKIEELITYCSAFPTEPPTGFRADIMPVIAEFYGIEFKPIHIPNEKTEDSSQPADLYTRAFNYLVEHTMFKISHLEQKWLTTDEHHDANHNVLLRFVKLYAKSAEKNQEHMDRLKKWAIFPNQLGQMCSLNDEKFLKNEVVEDDITDLYKKIMDKDLRATWVDDDFKETYDFKEQSPKSVGKQMEDDKLRPYLENKRKMGADFDVNNQLETAMLKIVNHLENGVWTEYFDFFAEENNLRNVSYELGTPKQKDALYRIKINTNEDTLERLAGIVGNPNALAILNKAELELEREQEEKRQFNFTFAIGTLIESEIRKAVGSALNVVFSRTLESYTATNEQNGQDIIIKRGENSVYYIECKAKWNFNEAAHMSSQQMKQAVREREHYALCCIDCTDKGCKIAPNSDMDKVQAASEDIIAHTYVHTDIGSKLQNSLETLIHEEDAEAVRSIQDKEQHIGIYSSLSCNIPYYVFVQGKTFYDFLEELINKISVHKMTDL